MADDVPAPMKGEIATRATDPLRWWYGGKIENDDTVLASRGQGKGLWLYDDLVRDPAVGSALAKRKLALTGREWTLEPADDSPAAKPPMDLVQQVLDALLFDRVAGDLLDATLKGVAVSEVMWTVNDIGIVPAGIVARDPRRFAFREGPNGEAELRLLTREQPVDGIAVPDRKFIVHRYGSRYGSPWGLGLGHQLFWPVFFKRQGIGFWLSAVEKFATPVPLGKYPPNTSEADQAKFLDALTAMVRDAAAIVPEGMLVEFLEAKRAGTFDTYPALAKYMDDDVTKIILGETLTTSPGDAGSRALGEVHNDVRLELVKSDADSLALTLNGTLVRWLVEVNLPGSPAPRLWWDFEEPEDLGARAKRDIDVASLGFTPTLDYIHEHYGEGWEAKPQPAPPPAMPPGSGQQKPGDRADAVDGLAQIFAEARKAASTRPRDAADDLADQLGDQAAQIDDPLMQALQSLVARADSLQAIADGLVALVPTIDDARLAELLAQAVAVAELTGRADLAGGG